MPAPRRFVIGVLLAFLPAAIVGALAHDFIKAVLFNAWIVCFTLIVGGAVLLWVDRMNLEPRYHDATDVHAADVSSSSACASASSMIPGVSRSGATIVGAMLLGADRRSAAEFSFWLAMPTMAGAFAYDLYKNRGQIGGSNYDHRRGRLRAVVRLRLDRGEDVPRLRAAPRLCAVRLVAGHRRLARADRAGAGEVTQPEHDPESGSGSRSCSNKKRGSERC